MEINSEAVSRSAAWEPKIIYSSQEPASASYHEIGRTHIIVFDLLIVMVTLPITVAARPKTITLFARSNTGIVVRIPLKAWMSVLCTFILCLCCSMCS
jgi:hypothetical protein